MTKREAGKIARLNTMACWWKGQLLIDSTGMFGELRAAIVAEAQRLQFAGYNSLAPEADHYNEILEAYLVLAGQPCAVVESV